MSCRNDHRKPINVRGGTTWVPYGFVRIPCHSDKIRNLVRKIAQNVVISPYKIHGEFPIPQKCENAHTTRVK